MSKNFATFTFVKPFTLAAEVAWGLRDSVEDIGTRIYSATSSLPFLV
jgi:hypothetical protein